MSAFSSFWAPRDVCHSVHFLYIVFSCLCYFFVVTLLSLGKFSTISLILCWACFCFFDCVGVVCLERKWTYQCLDFGRFRFLVCFYVIIVFVLLSHAFTIIAMVRRCDVCDSMFVIGEGVCSTSFHSQILLDLDYSSFSFRCPSLGQHQTIYKLIDWF